MSEILNKVLETKPFDCSGGTHEVHTLSGSGQMLHMLWSIKTYRFFSEVPFKLVIHSDGSFSKENRAILDKHLPGHRFVVAKDANNKVKEIIDPYKNLSHFRIVKNRVLFKKLIDYNIFSDSDSVVGLDTDILFTKKPVQMLEWIKRDKGFYMSDRQNAYFVRPGLWEKCTNYKLNHKINTGIINLPSSFEFDWDLAEYVANFCLNPPEDNKRGFWGGWIEQSIYAVLFSNTENFESLNSEAYAIPHPEVNTGLVAAHYVTPKRKFFEQHIKLLLHEGALNDLF